MSFLHWVFQQRSTTAKVYKEFRNLMMMALGHGAGEALTDVEMLG